MVILQACCAEVQDIPALKTSLKEFMVAEAAARKLSLKSLCVATLCYLCGVLCVV